MTIFELDQEYRLVIGNQTFAPSEHGKLVPLCVDIDERHTVSRGKSDKGLIERDLFDLVRNEIRGAELGVVAVGHFDRGESVHGNAMGLGYSQCSFPR